MYQIVDEQKYEEEIEEQNDDKEIQESNTTHAMALDEALHNSLFTYAQEQTNKGNTTIHDNSHNHNIRHRINVDSDEICADECKDGTLLLQQLLENQHSSTIEQNVDTDVINQKQPKKTKRRRKKRGRKRTKFKGSHFSRAKINKMQSRKRKMESFRWNPKSWVKKLFPKASNSKYETPKFRMIGGIDKFKETDNKFKPCYIGKMDQKCPHCGAMLFKDELSSSPNKWNLCCKNGKIQLKSPHRPPKALHRLFTSNTELAKYFRNNIILINSALALSSSQIFRKQLPHSNGRAPPTFIVSGQVYHTVPQLVPNIGSSPKQAQIYTWDPEQELDNRLNQGFLSKLQKQPKFRQLIKELQELLHDHNWIVKTYKTIYEQYLQNHHNIPELKLIIHTKVSDSTNLGHYKKYSKPSPDSPIATLIKFGDLTDPVPTHRKIVLTTRKSNENRTFRDFHALSDAFAFPLLYPYGECSYDMSYKKSDESKITMTEYYRYRLMERKNEWNPFIHGERLFQQYISATWAKIQQNTMNWYINNQKEFRADSYESVKKARAQHEDLNKLGKKLNILPKSFCESPRYFRSKYQNAMAILRQLDSIPDFFITFTANTKWREISETMEMHNIPMSCRDDIIARVFRAKLKHLLKDIVTNNGLGMYLY